MAIVLYFGSFDQHSLIFIEIGKLKHGQIVSSSWLPLKITIFVMRGSMI